MTTSAPPGACPGCGSPLRAGTRFCESCGAVVPQAPAACPRCGGQVTPGARFCGGCGAQLSAAPGAVAPPPSVSQAPCVTPPARQTTAVQAPQPAGQPAEPILAVVSTLSLRKGLLSYHEYNLIVTPQRLVFARVTEKMIQAAAMEAKQAARDQGKGRMAQWGAVVGARGTICDRYRQMSMESILAEDPESFMVLLQQVREIRTTSESDADDNTTDWLEVKTTGAKYRFKLAGGGADGARKTLRQVLGDLVR